MVALNPQSTICEPQSPEFSVIITCYFEERSIDEFYERLSKALKSLGRTYEIIFVNDGSTDKTFERLTEIFERDAAVSAVADLFRNAGQGAAMTAGITCARGRHFIFLDSDLQLDPEDLPRLIAKFDEGYDFVTGYRQTRQDSVLRMIPSRIANIIMRRVSKRALRDFGCNAKVVHGNLMRAYDFGPFKTWRLAQVVSQAGRVAEIPVNHHPRKYGKSGWTFRKLWQYNAENVITLSDKPFQALTVACMFLSALLILRILASWFMNFSVLSEVTSGLLLNVFLFGALVIFGVLCAVGEFSVRNFIILRREPAYIIRRILRR